MSVLVFSHLSPIGVAAEFAQMIECGIQDFVQDMVRVLSGLLCYF